MLFEGAAETSARVAKGQSGWSPAPPSPPGDADCAAGGSGGVCTLDILFVTLVRATLLPRGLRCDLIPSIGGAMQINTCKNKIYYKKYKKNAL